MLGTILFFVLAAIAVASAIGMLTSENAVHAALFLVINFITIAVFFLGLNAPFLGMVQVTLYAGAIMVLFVFVIMLLGAEHVPLSSRLRWQIPLAILLALVLVGVTVAVFVSPEANVTLPSITANDPAAGAADALDAFGSPANVGEALFSDYILPFELTGFLLLVAMVGAIVLARGPAIHESTRELERRMAEDELPADGEVAAD